jgi:histidinol phosphatase-like PHP family hydrolase/predicted nuclease with RNAse H fold/dephospho-CoA kinase
MTSSVRSRISRALSQDYFRIRDFEYAQPLYDLAFLLEVDALRVGREVPKYRIFSLWKAAYRMDGYTNAIDRWLDGKLHERELDIVPSARIRHYLTEIRETGTLTELAALDRERAESMLRLRSVRGFGASRIAELFRGDLTPTVQATAEVSSAVEGYDVGAGIPIGGSNEARNASETWQAAHVVPPLLRFLQEIDKEVGQRQWRISKIKDGIRPVNSPFTVEVSEEYPVTTEALRDCVAAQPLFRLINSTTTNWSLQHQQGWSFDLEIAEAQQRTWSVTGLARRLDPFTRRRSPRIRGDLHLHSNWSDGNSDISAIAKNLKKAGREYFALTDHSRSCKLQGGLTPVAWLRQAVSLRTRKLPCRVFHGIEVDILSDGGLDLPHGLLRGMDFVIGSVHSNWSASPEENTLRLLRAIESGNIDVLGHPTSAVVGKPGVPNYIRPPVKLDWSRIFQHCARWHVALELNCFPSRLDLALPALRTAVSMGCWISLGSDAHARAHLDHLRFGEHIIARLNTSNILNRLGFEELQSWVRDAREIRATLFKTSGELFSIESITTQPPSPEIDARPNPIQALPFGSSVVGLDLTAGHGKPTGVAFLEDNIVETVSLVSDDEILEFIKTKRPKFVSIDSPLGLPGGGTEINADAGIVRIAERDLASIGVPAYPALIDSMRDLTLRGIALKRSIESLPDSPTVFESYPGAAQDILCIPRKQKSLGLLRTGLSELGLAGPGLKTRSHDEMDAITSAVVGRYFEVGEYEPMGVEAEAQLIVPKVRPLTFSPPPVICLAGKTGAGKSTVARYLAVFYGFRWIKTRNVIRALLLDDIAALPSEKIFQRELSREDITDTVLTEFGTIVLQQYHQGAVPSKLMQLIHDVEGPVVVDAMRDIVDVNKDHFPKRSVQLWSVDASESRLLQRRRDRQRGPLAPELIEAIDQNANILRERSDYIVPNSGTLEDVRWRIDDALFSLLNLKAHAD